MKRISIESFVGKTFNYLTIVEQSAPVYRSNKKGSMKVTMWKCKCVCGTEKIISHGNLTSGSSKSCGCMKKEITKKCMQSYYKNKYLTPAEDRLYSAYKKETKKVNRKFEITKEKFMELVNSNCHYCGKEPFLDRFNKTKSVTKPLNGVDRIDSSQGYIDGNIVPCCVHCNRAKMDRNVEDFKKWVDLIYNNLHKNDK